MELSESAICPPLHSLRAAVPTAARRLAFQEFYKFRCRNALLVSELIKAACECDNKKYIRLRLNSVFSLAS